MARRVQRDQTRSSGKSIFHWEPEEKRPHKIEVIHLDTGDDVLDSVFRCRYCGADADSVEVEDELPCLSDEEKRVSDEKRSSALDAQRRFNEQNSRDSDWQRHRWVEAGACLACAEFHTSDRCDGRCDYCGDSPCSCRY